jgi:hypothetical protein
MHKYVAWMVMMIAGCGVAHAKRSKPPIDDWSVVERLAPGTEVNVQSGDMAGPDLCRISTVDANALTCLNENSSTDVRMIFPRAQVHDVWTFELAHDRHIVKWIFVAAGIGLGTAIFIANPFAGIVVVGPVTLAIAVGNWDPYRPIRPPRAPRIVRRLVYRGVTP